MALTLLHNALIFNEAQHFNGYLLIEDSNIAEIGQGPVPDNIANKCNIVFDLEGKWLLPGVIDDQVHFRDPGLTHKGDMETESRAAVAGGVTSFMDMPNTKPQTTSLPEWEWKMQRAANVSWANYAFFFGATNNNDKEIAHLNPTLVPGLKLFLGSSTGNMLVNDENALDRIFASPWLIAVHSEDENIIQNNIIEFRNKYGDEVPIAAHSLIRNNRACYESTRRAIQRAERFNTRLHILHISTAEEAAMLSAEPLDKRHITGEVCVHHLWFTDADYNRLGALIKWNPAVKSQNDRDELRRAITDGRIQIVATDHAPHLLNEKKGGALSAASGGPSLQYSLLIMLELAKKGVLSVNKVVELMCHNPALLFKIEKRGFLRKGYRADIVVVDPDRKTLAGEKIYSKCNWTPYKNINFSHSIHTTIINGAIAYQEGAFAYRNPEPLHFRQ